MKIIETDENTLAEAGKIHSETWKESHRGFCSAEFVAKHTPQAQTEYLRLEREKGKRLWMLCDPDPIGIVSVSGNLIENLYVLPNKQNMGYGSLLLQFAEQQCNGIPTLWILSNNTGARRFYLRHGFIETCNRKQLNDTLYETELTKR